MIMTNENDKWEMTNEKWEIRNEKWEWQMKMTNENEKCEMFKILLSYEDQDTGRFSNLH